jgi:hypothetical protein
MFYGGGLPSRLQLVAEGTWEMEKDKIFGQLMHLFPSKTPCVLSCSIFFKTIWPDKTGLFSKFYLCTQFFFGVLSLMKSLFRFCSVLFL